MVFKRRSRRSWLQIAADGVYPKGGWGRAASYVLHRLRRLPDPPHRIARGIAAGVFVSFSPFFGFHFVYAAAVAFLIQGNILAALLATFVGNPLTFPFIAMASTITGSWLLNVPDPLPLPRILSAFSNAATEIWANFTALFGPRDPQWGRLSDFFHRVFMPYLVGSIPPGLVAGALAYRLTVPAVTAYQKRRRRKNRKRAAQRRHRREAEASAEPTKPDAKR